MIDFNSAVSSAAKLQSFMPSIGLKVTTVLANVPNKALDTNQNIGTYDLIFPYLHKDFPTRDEVESFMRTCFNMHNNDVDYNTIVPNGKTEIDGNKSTTNSGLPVRSNSPVNAIGYGI